MDKNFLKRLNKFAIRNLMNYIIFGMAIVFVIDYVMQFYFTQYLYFDRELILQGQIFRIISFIFIPPNASVFFVLLSLYFYWLIGSSLENEWGSLKFNCFYLCGIIGSIIAGFISGFSTNHYLNMSLFFAFALLYPDYEILLFFVLPIKMKYLALINAVYFAYLFLISPLYGRLAIVFSLINVFIFFWKDAKNNYVQSRRRANWRRNTRL